MSMCVHVHPCASTCACVCLPVSAYVRPLCVFTFAFACAFVPASARVHHIYISVHLGVAVLHYVHDAYFTVMYSPYLRKRIVRLSRSLHGNELVNALLEEGFRVGPERMGGHSNI